MTDIFSNEIKVGDVIVFPAKTGTSSTDFNFREVLEITTKYAPKGVEKVIVNKYESHPDMFFMRLQSHKIIKLTESQDMAFKLGQRWGLTND